VKIEFAPTEKQWRFCTDPHKYIAYGGARGGGKSWALRMNAVTLAAKYPGIKEIIIRRTLQELRNNHINPLKELLGKTARYNKEERTFYMPNGSSITFGYCDNEGDLGQYQGAEYDIIYLDEATQLPEEWIKIIMACCRGVNSFPKHVYLTCNPGGQGHSYVKRLFVDRKFKAGEAPEEYAPLIQALVYDNKALMEADPNYINALRGLPPKLRAAWLEGSWDVYEGAFFEEFRDNPDGYESHQWSHVIKPFAPRRGWEIFRSMDWGYFKPFSVGWYAVDYDGVMYRILEWYGAQRDRNGEAIPDTGLRMSPEQVFAEIYRMEHEHPWLKGRKITGVADPAIFKSETGIPISETAAASQVFFTPGDNARIPGWMQCHYRLHFDENGRSMFYVFDSCRDFIRTITLQQYDQHKKEDMDTTLEDHAMDEWRYACNQRVISPPVETEEFRPMWGADPLNQFSEE